VRMLEPVPDGFVVADLVPTRKLCPRGPRALTLSMQWGQHIQYRPRQDVFVVTRALQDAPHQREPTHEVPDQEAEGHGQRGDQQELEAEV